MCSLTCGVTEDGDVSSLMTRRSGNRIMADAWEKIRGVGVEKVPGLKKPSKCSYSKFRSFICQTHQLIPTHSAFLVLRVLRVFAPFATC